MRIGKTKSNENSSASGENASTDSKPETRRKKTVAAVGIVAAVVVVAGAGFFAWHEQPSFCNAICHTPMDPYLPTYEAEPGEAAIDKWGNEVKDASAMMSATHRANSAEATCLDRHSPVISEQIAEGISWITSSYEVAENATYGVVLSEKSLSDLTAARGVEGEAFCLNESCHVNDDGSIMTKKDLAALTSHMNYNPHEAHIETECSDCHKAHRASVVTCTSCHGTMDVPEGWLTAAEASKLETA